MTLSMKRMRMKIKVIYKIQSGLNWKRVFSVRTFKPYCSFATMGLSEMKVNSFRLTVKGRGRIRPMKSPISATRRTKT